MAIPIQTEADLLSLGLALGASRVRGWSDAEQSLVRGLPMESPHVDAARRDIQQGRDPLGDIFCTLRTPVERRPQGATYTPPIIVEAMTRWADLPAGPSRIVDLGAGSGRFIVAAGQRFRDATLLAVELDPVAALLCRAHLAASGLAERAEVVVSDYRALKLPEIDGRTLFIGNPPYVRHHLLGDTWKQWLVRTAKQLRLEVSQLAGLHVHFFLATALHAKPGDYGTVITAAEWMDVNYGKLVRSLFLGPLGGRSIDVIEPAALPFSDAAATAAITCFVVGERPSRIQLRRIESLEDLDALQCGKSVRRERLENSPRWSPLTRATKRGPDGYVELGELCHVHRGQVTGANKIWIEGPHSEGLPESVLFHTVTKAKELFTAGRALSDPSSLRRVIDIPADLDCLDKPARLKVEKFLKTAAKMGADKGFIATHRKAWWSVGLKRPAPLLATYMARRPPAFVRNLASARHINIAHGIYPRQAMSEKALIVLAGSLARSTTVHQGRTYAGGLTKFEPKEMERLLVPGPELLEAGETDGTWENAGTPTAT